MDQGGRLKRLAGRQPAGQGDGQPAQLRVDDRQQFRRLLDVRRGRAVALFSHHTAPEPVGPRKKIENRDSPRTPFSDDKVAATRS